MKKTVSWPAWAGFFAVLFCLWWAAAGAVDNIMVLPSPPEVIRSMADQLMDPGFWPAVGLTLGRIVLALAISLASGMVLALTAFLVPATEFFLSRLLLILRSVPNIAFIILTLFWMDREAAVLLVLWLLLVPIVYSALYSRLEQIRRSHAEFFHVFPQPWTVRMKEVFLPELAGTWPAVITTASSLACKAGVMAEILCQVPGGIGRGMQASKFALDTPGVIAWTIWLLVFAFLLDRLWKILPACIERIRS